MLKYINIYVYILIFGPLQQCFCEDTPNKFDEDAVLRFAANQDTDVKYDINAELHKEAGIKVDDPMDLYIDPIDKEIDPKPQFSDPIDEYINTKHVDPPASHIDPPASHIDQYPGEGHIDPIDKYIDIADAHMDHIDTQQKPKGNPSVVDALKKNEFNKMRDSKPDPKKAHREEYHPATQDIYSMPKVATHKMEIPDKREVKHANFDQNTLQTLLASECPAYAAKVAQEYSIENLPIWVQIFISQTPVLVLLQDGIYTLYIQHWQTVANLFKVLYDIIKESLHTLVQIADQLYMFSPIVCQFLYGIIGFMLLCRILFGKFIPFTSRKPENVVEKLLESQQMQTLFTQMKKVANQPRVLSGDSKGSDGAVEFAPMFERLNQFMAQQQIQQERNQKNLVCQAQQLSDAIEQQSRFAIFIAQILRHMASNGSEPVPLPQLDEISGKQPSVHLASVAQDIFDMVSPRMMNPTNLDMMDVNSNQPIQPEPEATPIVPPFSIKSPRNAPPPSFPMKPNMPPPNTTISTLHETPADSRMRDPLTSRSASHEGHLSPRSEAPYEYGSNAINGIAKPDPIQGSPHLSSTKVSENANPNMPPLGGGWNPPNMKYPAIPQPNALPNSLPNALPNALPNGTHNPPQASANISARQRRERKEPPKVQAATNPFGLNTTCVNPIPGEVDF